MSTTILLLPIPPFSSIFIIHSTTTTTSIPPLHYPLNHHNNHHPFTTTINTTMITLASLPLLPPSWFKKAVPVAVTISVAMNESVSGCYGRSVTVAASKTVNMLFVAQLNEKLSLHIFFPKMFITGLKWFVVIFLYFLNMIQHVYYFLYEF